MAGARVRRQRGVPVGHGGGHLRYGLLGPAPGPAAAAESVHASVVNAAVVGATAVGVFVDREGDGQPGLDVDLVALARVGVGHGDVAEGGSADLGVGLVGAGARGDGGGVAGHGRGGDGEDLGAGEGRVAEGRGRAGPEEACGGHVCLSFLCFFVSLEYMYMLYIYIYIYESLYKTGKKEENISAMMGSVQRERVCEETLLARRPFLPLLPSFTYTHFPPSLLLSRIHEARQ